MANIQSSNFFVRLIASYLMDINRTLPLVPFIPSIIVFLVKTQQNHELLANRQIFDKEYDYIVIGAGSGGSVMAARLSEDGSKTVLLIEAGRSENIISDIPMMATSLAHTPMDWAFLTEPQKKCCAGLVNRRSHWQSGKAVGGSSAINHMVYVRGNARDYDKWAADGADGWSWREVFPYFIKAEDNRDSKYVNSGYHGVGGPLTVTTATAPTRVAIAFGDSAQYFNATADDVNGAVQSVFDIPQRTIRDGQRCSVATAYLQPIMDRKNLHILANTEARRIIFNSEKRAIGVELRRRFLTHLVRAKSEIILSAGPINSPKILMLSGVGPKAHLESLKIPVIADLPVGDNLQDHVSSGVHYTVNDTISLGLLDASPMRLLEYYVTKNNTLTSNLIEGISFVKSKYADPNDDWPDIQLHVTPGSFVADFGVRSYRLQGVTPDIWQKVFKANIGRDTFSIYATLLRPKTKGRIRLKSKRFSDQPSIEPNYFDIEDDLKVLADGLKMASRIGLSPAFQKYNSQLFSSAFPGCERIPLYTDQYFTCLASVYTISNSDAVGTCKMGSLEDSTAVVDPQLRVKGVIGLRVVDSSVMPTLISGFTNSVTTVIAEKAADLVRGRRLKPLLPPLPKSVIDSLPNGLEYEQLAQQT